MKKLAISATVLLSLVVANAAPALVLRLGTDDWQPYETIGNPAAPGFSTEVIRAVFGLMKQDIDIQQYPWARAQSMVYDGSIDGLFTAFYSDERAKNCYFPAEPLAQDAWVMFVLRKNLKQLTYRGLPDLAGEKVGVVRGAAVSPEFWAFVKQHHLDEESVDDEQNFKMLEVGRVNYVVASRINGMDQIRTMGLGDDIVPILAYPLKKDNLYVMFSKKTVSPDTVAAFSDALKKYKQTDAFRLIYQKYFDSPYVAHR